MIFDNNDFYDKFKCVLNDNKDSIKEYKKKLSTITRNKAFNLLLSEASKVYKVQSQSKLNTKRIYSTSISINDISSPFIDFSIQETIETIIKDKNTYMKTFYMMYKSVNICINLLYGDNLKKININNLYKFLNIIIPFLLKCKDDNSKKSITISIIPTSFKKYFNKDTETSLTISNINSGFTTHMGEDKRIIIYRYEECFKVLLHELIHAFGLDLSDIQLIQTQHISITNEIRSILNVDRNYNKGRLLLDETYCEFWTIFIYTLFYSLERTIKMNINETYNVFIERYSIEYMYTILKTGDIIEYNTKIYDYDNDIFVMSSSLNNLFQLPLEERNNLFKMIFNRKTQATNTSLLEYIPLKMILMSNIDLLFKLREPYKNPINIQCDDKQLNELLTFIKLIIMTTIKKNTPNNIKNKTCSLNNTLCMSLFS